MNGLTDLMASSIRPLKRRRRTAQRGKPMTQSQRWGKVVTIMPVPEGEITTTEILVPEVVPVESIVEEALEEAIRAADAEVAVEVKPAPKKRAKKV
jgi:hypothetical protein